MKNLERGLKEQIEKYHAYPIIVEGKKDALVLKSHGFFRVFMLHKPSIGLRERIESIVSALGHREPICILTDLDKKGTQLHDTIKPILQDLGFPIDEKLREIFIQEKITHIEGISKFLNALADD